jgi:hypothetical protein
MSSCSTCAMGLVEVQRPRLHEVAAGEGQQLMGEFGRAVGGQLDLPDVIADRAQVGLRAVVGHLLADERRVVRDDGEQVVEVVRDAAGELAEALQPLRLLQLAFQLVPLGLASQPLALGLQFQPLGHVADRGDDQEAVVGVDRRQRDLRAERAAVTAAGGQFHRGAHRPRAGVGHVPGPVTPVRLPRGLGYQRFHRLAHEFFAPVPEQALGLGVHQHDPPVAVHAHHRVRRPLEQPGERVISELHVAPLDWLPSRPGPGVRPAIGTSGYLDPHPQATVVKAEVRAGLDRRRHATQPCPGGRRAVGGRAAGGRRRHVQLEEDQVRAGLYHEDRPVPRSRGAKTGQDQFGHVGHGLDVAFRERLRPLADRYGQRGGQQPGGPLLQRLDQAGPEPGEGPELVLEAAEFPADPVKAPDHAFGRIAAGYPQLERHRRERLDRPVMQQAGQMTALAGPEPADNVEHRVERGSSGAGGGAGRGSWGGALRILVVHDHLRGSGDRARLRATAAAAEPPS